MFVTLFTTRIILQGLGAADYGIFNIVGGSITMLGFINSTMARATQRFINISMGEGDEEKLKTIFNVTMVIHAIISIFVGIVLVLMGMIFFHDILNIPEDRIYAAQIVYGSLIAGTVFGIMSSPYEAILISHENMKYFAIISVFENILKLIAAYACILATGDKLVVYGSLMACIPIITLTIMRVYCHRQYQECIVSPKKYWSTSVVKEMSSFAGWNFLTASTSLICAQGMGLVLNSFFGVLLNAAQGIANQLGGAFAVFSSNALKVLNPILEKSEGAKDRSRVHYVTLLGCRMPTVIFYLFAIPGLYLVPDILDIWLDTVPEWAVLFTRLQIVRNMFNLPFRSLGTAIYAQGNIKNYTIFSSVNYIAPLFFAGLFFHYGAPPYYLYVVWIAFEVIEGFNMLYFCNKLTNLPAKAFFNSVLLPCFFVAVISMGAYLLPSFCGWDNLLITRMLLAVASSILYIVLSYIFSLEPTEKAYIIARIQKKRASS